MKPLKKNATYDNLREVPDYFVAEMFDGDRTRRRGRRFRGGSLYVSNLAGFTVRANDVRE